MPWIALKTVHSPMHPYQMLSSKLCIPQASRKCKSTRESDKREEGDIASRFVLSTHRLVAAMFPFPFRSRAIFVAMMMMMMITRSSVRSCATTTRPSRSISVVTFFLPRQKRHESRLWRRDVLLNWSSMCARGFLSMFFVVFLYGSSSNFRQFCQKFLYIFFVTFFFRLVFKKK